MAAMSVLQPASAATTADASGGTSANGSQS
jgi:hypothetical protein